MTFLETLDRLVSCPGALETRENVKWLWSPRISSHTSTVRFPHMKMGLSKTKNEDSHMRFSLIFPCADK